MKLNKYLIEFNKEEVKYVQLAKHIKRLIDKGVIENEEKLPPIRQLSKELRVNNVTIVNAYKKLQQEGYALLKMGSGTYAKKKENNLSFKREYSNTFRKLNSNSVKEIIDFAGETTSSSYFPVQEFKEILNQVIDRDGAEALTYQEALGYEGLRDIIHGSFWNDNIDYNDILIVSGAQQGIDIISKALINVNDNVIVEKPTYGGALSVFQGRRANIYEVDIEKDGVNLESFEKILMKNNIKVFYTMSYFQNPTGATYSLEKKRRILELAEIYDFYIVEDDYLSELIYDKNITYESFKSLDFHDRVIYIKSFSKIFLPGIRIGYIVTPSKFRDSIQNCKINTDISTSSLMQRALSLYIEKGLWKSHIEFLNKEYRARYSYMEKYLKEKLKDKVSFISPGGGLTFFIQLNDNVKISSTELFYKAREKKVLITPAVIFYKNPREGLRAFRIGYSQTNERKIKEGLDILCRIMEESYEL